MSTSKRLKTKLEVYTTEQLKTLIRTMSDCPKRAVAKSILVERQTDSEANHPKSTATDLNVLSICSYDVRKISPTNLELISSFLQGCTNAELRAIRKKAKLEIIRDMVVEISAMRRPRGRPQEPTGLTYNTILNSSPPKEPIRKKTPNQNKKSNSILYAPMYGRKRGAKYRQELDRITEPAPLTDLERTYQIPDDGNRPRWS